MVTRVGPPAPQFPGSMAVAVAEPYDIAYLRDTSTYLATYPDNPVSMESVARVIGRRAVSARTRRDLLT